MARSPLTLAASVTAALPRIGVTRVAALTENASGRFDAAIVHLDDERTAVVRLPATEEFASDLAAESRALHALTPGVRALLPFAVPDVLGENGSGVQRVLVTTHLEGYRIDPAHLPKGPGYAPAIGGALAAIHGLPVSIVRTDGLPVRSAEQIRDDTARLLDRADGTDRVPDGLMLRWRQALRVDELWRFESAVVLGGATSASVLLEDDDAGIPHVTGVLDWAGLSVGDPAVDLRWMASAPLAADDVFEGYTAAGDRSPDPLLRERARLYAELEFARWLVHGYDAGESAVVADAVALLDALVEGVRGDHIVGDSRTDIDDALALVDNVPPAVVSTVDTSMQTDAYDPEALSLYLSAERDREAAAAGLAAALANDDLLDVATDAPTDAVTFDLPSTETEEPGPTAPIDLDGWTDGSWRGAGASNEAQSVGDPDEGTRSDTSASVESATGRPSIDTAPPASTDDEEDAARASRAALRRWGVTGDGS